MFVIYLTSDNSNLFILASKYPGYPTCQPRSAGRDQLGPSAQTMLSLVSNGELGLCSIGKVDLCSVRLINIAFAVNHCVARLPSNTTSF